MTRENAKKIYPHKKIGSEVATLFVVAFDAPNSMPIFPRATYSPIMQMIDKIIAV